LSKKINDLLGMLDGLARSIFALGYPQIPPRNLIILTEGSFSPREKDRMRVLR